MKKIAIAELALLVHKRDLDRGRATKFGQEYETIFSSLGVMIDWDRDRGASRAGLSELLAHPLP